MSEYEKMLKDAWWQILCLSIIAAILILFPFVDAFKPDDQPIKLWFPRIGAPIAIFALLAQNKVNYLGELLTPNTFSTAELNELSLRYKKKQRIGNAVSLFLTMVGTLIWGYGDLIW